MRRFTVVLLGCLALGVQIASPLAPAAHAQSPSSADRLSDADLEELLAPIALYPDPLLANVLAASCYPDELAAAGKAGGRVDASWEDPVKAIAKAPDALKLLTEYPEWTRALGEAFVFQSQDVMSAVQRLRARAYASGALTTTEQQVVHADGDTIIIQPAEPDVIYVPYYEPSVVYVDDPGDEVAAGVIGFGLGITAGLIIANNIDCDWWGGGCCWGCGWGHGDVDIDINVDHNTINNIKNNGNTWKPNSDKLPANVREGRPQAMSNYKGVGTGRAAGGQIPNRASGAAPIAGRPAPRPSQVNRPSGGTRAGAPTRPSAQSIQRPEGMQRAETPRAKPSIPPAAQRPPVQRDAAGSPAASRPSRPSAYGGGGSRSQAASRGAASRGHAGGSRGGSRGGGRRG